MPKHPIALVHKTFHFEIKSLEENGTFNGYASTFLNVDFDNDRIMPGAFKRTIQHSEQAKQPIPILWQHDYKAPIGKNLMAREDDHGLFVEGMLDLNVQQAREAYSMLKLGIINGLSIGYRPIKVDPRDKEGIRNIREVQLAEYSVVTFPANDQAVVTDVKHIKPSSGKGVSMDFEQMVKDFQTALDTAHKQEDLYKMRYKIENAKTDAVQFVYDAEDLSHEDKTKSVTEIYTQYATIMSGLHEKHLKLISEAKEMQTNFFEDLKKEQKSSARMSATTKAVIMHAVAQHEAAHAMHSNGVKMNLEAARMCKSLVEGATTDNSYDNPNPNDVNPVPTRRKEQHNPDPDEQKVHSLVDMLAKTVGRK